MSLALAVTATVLWAALLVVPWQPWRNREVLDPQAPGATHPDRTDLTDITVLIPARNEADTIATTLAGVAAQGPVGGVLVVDDRSDDDTAARAHATRLPGLTVMPGRDTPAGWSGKLWALEQGRRQVGTGRILLLDADIGLAPGTLAALVRKMDHDVAPRALVSLMATPSLTGFWERLLMPAFIYFFRLLYPFALANARSPRVAAAAGGCVLVDAAALERMGGFAKIHDALIDDCALARAFKDAGLRTWVGLSHGARSLRPYPGLRGIVDMVARTAFTQLRYRRSLLAACTVAMALVFAVPVVGTVAFSGAAAAWAAAAWALLAISYLPTLRFYGLHPLWAPLLPVVGTLYLGMTWLSAIRYWRGERSRWKGRVYGRGMDQMDQTEKTDPTGKPERVA